MSRVIALLYGIAVYVLFFVTFLYAIAFVGDFLVPKTINSGAQGDLVTAIVIDVVLLGIFAVQHSLMARPFFKRAWTRIVPPAAERSTYVLFSSLALILLYWLWRPIDGTLWSTSGNVAIALWIVFAAGWGIVLISTLLIDHFDLFGLRQVWAYFRRQSLPAPEFKTPVFYRAVRHPIYLGFLLGFWATPVMTYGHLLFAIACTGYMLIAIQFEEHDLIGTFGNVYVEYRRRVSMIIPWPPKRQM